MDDDALREFMEACLETMNGMISISKAAERVHEHFHSRIDRDLMTAWMAIHTIMATAKRFEERVRREEEEES